MNRRSNSIVRSRHVGKHVRDKAGVVHQVVDGWCEWGVRRLRYGCGACVLGRVGSAVRRENDLITCLGCIDAC